MIDISKICLVIKKLIKKIEKYKNKWKKLDWFILLFSSY